mmetsp:Transcript_93634/g.303102  ORF Transcript_93634/g.303102 Transcript_93634/m.303102 type:complete len:226 (+) Transcript_93634:7182-7859(+)
MGTTSKTVRAITLEEGHVHAPAILGVRVREENVGFAVVHWPDAVLHLADLPALSHNAVGDAKAELLGQPCRFPLQGGRSYCRCFARGCGPCLWRRIQCERPPDRRLLGNSSVPWNCCCPTALGPAALVCPSLLFIPSPVVFAVMTVCVRLVVALVVLLFLVIQHLNFFDAPFLLPAVPCRTTRRASSRGATCEATGGLPRSCRGLCRGQHPGPLGRGLGRRGRWS